ncbi:MAG: DUF378 domain-containing protein [Candidatus Zixiibacteriota bacterium]|nr:MAG: DUF378 domain-containing protein [candidate division Zixibacteria bacterium]
MKTLDVIVAILLVIGGLNWGLIGVFRFDVVAAIFGDMGVITRIIYILVGVCAIYRLILWKSIQSRCGKSPSAPHPET